MVFKTLDDIEKEAEARSRREFKEKISGDIKGIFDGIFIPPKKPKKKKENWFLGFLKWLGILFLGLLIINIILGCIWLLKFFLKDFFGV